MLSYAQQWEDVVLRRAFPDVEDGFYVDVGAADPVNDSVTKYFYDKGWRGINIEPMPDMYAKLQADRPEDINLCLAIDKKVGRTTLALFDAVAGWSTTDEATAAMHNKSGLEARKITVDTAPLEKVLKEHASDRYINFIKIDVEGSERKVLESFDLEEWQPGVLVVEATLPGSPKPSYEWEDIVLGAGYKLGLFDGLNRFYAKDPAILESISLPVNSFDQPIQYRLWRLIDNEKQRRFKQEHGLGAEIPLT